MVAFAAEGLRLGVADVAVAAAIELYTLHDTRVYYSAHVWSLSGRLYLVVRLTRPLGWSRSGLAYSKVLPFPGCS